MNFEPKSKCGFCNKNDSIQLYPTSDIYGNEYFINLCNNCKAYFLSPRPDEIFLNSTYDSSYYGRSSNKFSLFIESLVDFFRSSRAKHIHRLLLNVKHPKVLDIGCGNGRFLMHLSSYGDYELYGNELEGNSANRALGITGINLMIGPMHHDDFPKENFDGITLFHVFEHLLNPEETLNIIRNILKKDGILVMSFPNITSTQSRIFKGNWFHLDPPRHLFYFSPKKFIDLMKSYGFRHIKSNYLSLEQNPFGMIQSILNVFCKKREVLYERLKGNKTYAPEYSGFNIFLQKIFFIFLFPLLALTDIIGSFFKKGATVEITFRKE